MSLLAPWFLLAGVAAISLPVLFHLFRRTPRGRQIFSTLMFLTPSPPRMTRRSRLDQWPLLLVRAAILALLGFAFGRPFLREWLEEREQVPAGERLVVLLDTSASMRRTGLWTKAVDAARQVVSRAGPHDELALVSFAQAPRSEVTFAAWRAAPLGERSALFNSALTALEPGWSATRLDQALIDAAEMLETADQSIKEQPIDRPRRVVLISDLQAGSSLAALQNYDWPKRIPLEWIAISTNTTNAAVHALSASESTERDNSAAARPRVIVTNAASSSREAFQLAWNKPATATAAKSTEPASNEPEASRVDVYVPPSQSRSVRTPPLPAEPAAELVLTGDDEPFDNRFWFVPPPRERVRIVQLTDEPADDSQTLRFFVERAFGGSGVGRIVEVESLNPLKGETPPPLLPQLEDVALVIVSLDAAIPPAWIEILRQWCGQGGVLLTVINRVESAGWRELLPLSTDERAALTLTEVAPAESYSLWSSIDLRHPLFAPFADPRFSDFTKIHFWRHRRLTLGESVEKQARVLARFDSNDPAVIEFRRDAGRVVLMTTGWRPRDSQLGVSSKFVPLLTMLVELGWRRPIVTAQYDAGQVVDLATLGAVSADAGETKVEPVRFAGPWTVKAPSGKETRVAVDQPRFDPSEGPGVYEVRNAERLIRLAVNLAAEESKTAPLAFEALESLGVPRYQAAGQPAQPLTAAERRTLQSRELESRQQLWRWCVVAALGAIVFETWLAGAYNRRDTAPAAEIGSTATLSSNSGVRV